MSQLPEQIHQLTPDVPFNEDITNALYLAIKNDKQYLERVFQSMFVVARRYLGFASSGSSYPFTTTTLPAQHGQLRSCVADGTNREKEVLVSEKGTVNEKHYVVSFATAREYATYGLMREAFKDVAESLEIRQEDFSKYKRKVNHQQIGVKFMNEYFDDMVTFARQSRAYMTSWQNVCVCTS